LTPFSLHALAGELTGLDVRPNDANPLHAKPQYMHYTWRAWFNPLSKMHLDMRL
jgi:hypothetical protein